MDRERIDKALARLDAGTARAESAARALSETMVGADEHTGLQKRHARLKESLAQSLRQLDEILAGMPR